MKVEILSGFERRAKKPCLNYTSIILWYEESSFEEEGVVETMIIKNKYIYIYVYLFTTIRGKL